MFLGIISLTASMARTKQGCSINAVTCLTDITSIREQTSATASSTEAAGTKASIRATWRCMNALQHASQPTRLKDPTARRCSKTMGSFSNQLHPCRLCPSRRSRLGRWVASRLLIRPTFPIAISLLSFDYLPIVAYFETLKMSEYGSRVCENGGRSFCNMKNVWEWF